jgi:maltooligosyltrehalose trehalohydrolase
MTSRAGAHVIDGRTRFSVWAPQHEYVQLALDGGEHVEMVPRDDGWHEVSLDGDRSGARYRFRVGDDELPDPASRWQPDGVHGASAVVARDFAWSDDRWQGIPLADYVISEVHIGTYTPEGTFDAAAAQLSELVDLGVTAVEVMPIAEFPGTRNWGYDGVFPYAAQHSYGGPDGFKRFVDAAHGLGLAVVLDVVYNHLGPEGNHLGAYGPYFTDQYRTPWGDAINFDGPGSDNVRAFFVDNALQWVDEFHVDALRLDAVHAIVDASAYPFVEELTNAVHEVASAQRRYIYAIAESAANDARLIAASERGGLGCDAQWSDDFHHALHALLTGERMEYYEDFGTVDDLAVAYREGYTYAGRFSPFRQRRHGRSAAGLPGERFVVFAQNHDHIGNRAAGERLSALVGTAGLQVAAAAVLCAPFVPLLFMGEEWGASAPFPYFTSHSDPELVEGVRRGRQEEFAQFHSDASVPDPQDDATFRSAVLDRREREKEPHATLLDWHRRLLALRREVPALRALDPQRVATEVFEEEHALVVTRHADGDEVVIVLRFGGDDARLPVPLSPGRWRVLLDSHASTADGTVTVPDGAGPTELERPGPSVLLLQRQPSPEQ